MGRKKVVLADDVELFLILEKTFFNREEFELITARSGREALEAIRERAGFGLPGSLYARNEWRRVLPDCEK